MKIKTTKILALVFALMLVLGLLPACGSGKNGDPAVTAKVDDEWRDALPSDKVTTKAEIGDKELDAKVKEALGADSDWDGKYASLTSEQKSKITAYFAKDGYSVEITDSGIVVKTKPLTPVEDTYEEAPPVSDKVLSGITAGTVTAFGGAGNAMFERVVATQDGGFVTSGFFSVAGGDFSGADKNWSGNKSMLVKYDKNSKVEWKAFLGGDGGGLNFRGLTQLADNSFVIAGDTNSPELGAKNEKKLDAVLIKYSAAGKREWIKTIGGSQNEYFNSIAATPDGGFVVGGKTESSDGDFEGLHADAIKAVLIKFDASGTPHWKRAIAGTKHNDFEGVAVNKDGAIFATCKTMSNDGDFEGIAGRGEADTLVFSYDKNGKFNWVRSFSGSGADELTAVACSPDGGCVIAGKYSILGKADGSFAPYHNAGEYDSFIVKYNKNGSIGWAKPFAGFKSEEITGITAVSGGYAAVGISSSDNRDFAAIGNKGGRDGFLLLINELGETVKLIGLAGTAEDVPRATASNDGNRVFVVGGTSSPDHFFAGLTPTINKNLYNCFTADFTIQFQESETSAA
ncbi:MAG TPA: hypothetical protein VFD23_02150 [Clostridia bacterium]|nr:hypothetical protein [Clostridia bacterium]